jgi:hypothetical protein
MVFQIVTFEMMLPKYMSAITTDNLYFFYSVCSLHVSAPTGHPQVKQHYLYIYENHHTTAHPLFHKYINDDVGFHLKMARKGRNM